jgi:hypothetical protein
MSDDSGDVVERVVVERQQRAGAREQTDGDVR